MDRQILTADAMRVTEIEKVRKELHVTETDISGMNKFGLKEEASEPIIQQQLRKGYLGGLGKAARGDSSKENAEPCAFSGYIIHFMKCVGLFDSFFVICREYSGGYDSYSQFRSREHS